MYLQTSSSSKPTNSDQTAADPSRTGSSRACSPTSLSNFTTNIPWTCPSSVQLGGPLGAAPISNPPLKSSISSTLATVLSINGSLDLHTFSKAFVDLAMKDNHSKALRQNAWKEADPKGNGYISLAEFDAWIKKHLSSTSGIHADRLWRLYRPCYARAHSDAADIMKETKVCCFRVGRVSTSSHNDCIQQLLD